MNESLQQELFGLLSEDERQRAARFHFDRDRRRFVACRARQRLILVQYVDAPASELCFVYGSSGKPALGPAWDISGIRFNTSNSGEMALLAVAKGRDVGVDVEQIRPLPDINGLARRYFAAVEQKALAGLPPEQQLVGFFCCWTRKEALLKAIGQGLAFPLNRLAVSLAPNEPAKLLDFDGNSTASGRWWLHSMQPADGYVAALASPGGPTRVEHWYWQD